MAGPADIAAVAAAAAASSAQPLAGRVAIVTGGSRGIGRAIAAHLSAMGASVVVGYSSSAAEAESLAASLPRAVAVRADVADESAVRSLFDAAESAFGSPPHILVANAGVLDDAYPTVAATSAASFDRVVGVNLRGAFLCLREAANRLPRGGEGGGRIVAVTSSVTGSHPTGYAAYTASKAAVEAMVRTMAKELKGTRITANCVAPGATATDMFFAGKSEETVRMYAETNPMERLGEPGDIAPVVGFLCTDAAEWVNGQVIRANGGRHRLRSLLADGAPAAGRQGGHRDVRVARHRPRQLRGRIRLPRGGGRVPGRRAVHAVAARADVADEAAVRALYGAAPPHILVVVACAGVMKADATLAATSAADFDANTRGAFLCLREAANRLRRGGGGRILAVTSSAVASLSPGFKAYAGSKAAVEAMVRGVAKELKGTRVTANCVAPGPVATTCWTYDI
ncbi:hypothetical protein EJB05_15176, partial [Eragrostis curvula]